MDLFARKPTSDEKQISDKNGKKPTFGNLLDIAVDALKFWPPDYIRSVLGPVSTWLPPQNPYSEFTMLDPWRLRRALKYIIDVTVPSVSAAPPAFLASLLPPVIEDLFFVQTEVLHRPDYYDDYTSFPREKWFFINGILTNGDVAQLNAACISYLFHRPVTLVQNATDGAVMDLFECALGKEWYRNTSNTEAARIAFPAIYDALTDPDKDKVVVICHSQGTIIMSVVLHALQALHESRAGAAQLEAAARDLLPEGAPLRVSLDETTLDLTDFEPLEEEEWDKLEVYFFATCANDIKHHACRPDHRPVPWMEHFGNERDLVARLGMFAPEGEERNVTIEGARFIHRGAWGHLMNIDYLLPIAEEQKRGRRRGGRCDSEPFSLDRMEPRGYAYTDMPKLFTYINGGPPRTRQNEAPVQTGGYPAGTSSIGK
ncbi:MAG: hypothetical protein ACM30E_00850 [Nitrososphaerales archaeon]